MLNTNLKGRNDMRVIIAGCEYSGTSTFAFGLDDWLSDHFGARFPLIHDHWKLPDTSGHPQADMTDDEREQVLALSPDLKEMTQRHSLYYHIQANSWNGPDWLAVGLHIDDGVYGPLYYGYGGDGMPHDRKVVGRQVEESILKFAPDMILVHLKADAEIIAQRMDENPRPNSPLKREDIPAVLDAYQDAVDRSILRHKITLDTSKGTAYHRVMEFASKAAGRMTQYDMTRRLYRDARRR